MTDAWQQLDDLWRRYTRDWEIRADIQVQAVAHERGVKLALGDRSNVKRDKAGKATEHVCRVVTQRNVGTMRELAGVLLEACDFVDESNPEWAGRRSPPTNNVDNETLRNYLDTAIRHWRKRVRAELVGDGAVHDHEMAKCYVDAYQSVRVSMLGELLPEE